LVVLILAGGGYFLLNRKNTSPELISDPEQAARMEKILKTIEQNRRLAYENSLRMTPNAGARNPAQDVQRTLKTVQDINRINQLNRQSKPIETPQLPELPNQ